MVISFKRSVQNMVERVDPSWQRALIAFLGLRFLTSLWFWLIQVTGLMQATSGLSALEGLEPATTGFRGLFVDIWLRWDGVHYLRIAELGYAGDVRSGFYPLYPMLGRAVGWLFGGDLWIGLLFVSNLAALLSFYLLDRWMVSLGWEEQASWALAGLALFPTAFFLLAGYPHSLLLLLVLIGVLCAAHGRWTLAFIAGLAAGLTHPTAFPLFILFVFWPGPRRSFARYLAATGPLLGISLFLAWRMAAGFPGYGEMARLVWGRQLIAPWVALVQAQENLGWPILIGRSWPSILVAIASILTIRWAAKNLSQQHAAYQGGLVLMLLASGTRYEFLAGFSRYALSSYPLFAALPWFFGSGRKRLLVLVLSGMIQLYLAGLFVLWAFVG